MLVVIHSQFPCCVQSAFQDSWVRFGENDMGHSHASPPTLDGDEDFWSFANEVGLLLGREFEVAVTFGLRCEGGEDTSADTKVGRAHVRTFLGAFQAECNAAEIGYSHNSFLNGFEMIPD